jgi:molybdenum cofactor guanylyltransferase
MPKAHEKHTALPRPDMGHFSRNEWAFLGAPCVEIQALARALTARLRHKYRLAYVDADHKSGDSALPPDTFLGTGGYLDYTDMITHDRFDYKFRHNDYQRKLKFRAADLVLINGNHFLGRNQVVIVHRDKLESLERKLDRLTNVHLILLAEGMEELPDFLQAKLEGELNPQVHRLEEVEKIAAFLDGYLTEAKPRVRGLVLAGGKSLRMQQDKSLLEYHGKPQRTHASELLSRLGLASVHLSCRPDQVRDLDGQGFDVLPDTFTGLGPFGGILSAFRAYPQEAWLVLAVDLPFLTEDTLGLLLAQRDPSRLATAFQNPHNEFPEPLIAIWEPRAYPMLLQFLSLGYSCPRKVLINGDIRLLNAPRPEELTNINHPEEYEAAKRQLGETSA